MITTVLVTHLVLINLSYLITTNKVLLYILYAQKETLLIVTHINNYSL